MAQVISFQKFEQRRAEAQFQRDLTALRTKPPRANSKAAKAAKAGAIAYAVRISAMTAL